MKLQYQRSDPEKDVMNLVKKGLRSPLYHLMGRSWMELFSDRVTTPRGVSALISLLALPCMYLLCRELFESPLDDHRKCTEVRNTHHGNTC